MDYVLRKLSTEDGMDIYNMLQEMPEVENGFMNGAKGLTYEEFKDWLVIQDNIAKGIGLEEWMTEQTIYWLYIDNVPVGFGKVRKRLTKHQRKVGGHVGYAIKPSERKKGYGKLLLDLLINKARERGINKVQFTILSKNKASIAVARSCGGDIDYITSSRHYFYFD